MKMLLALCILASSACAASAWTVPLADSVLHAPHASSRARTRAQMSRWASVGAPGGRTFSPADFGGDPSGKADSTHALALAVAALLNASAASPPSRVSAGVADCGGAALDLAGGEYLISAPLVVPSGYGNFRITQGTLRASPSFPPARYLVEIGGAGASSGIVDFAISGVFLDASQVAAGCLQTNGVQGGVVGPQFYAFNFTQIGIAAHKGFELTIQQTWVAQFWWSAKAKFTNGSVGILKDGNDGAILDVVVFSAQTGVVINGGANIVDSVHTWSAANGQGGIGILVNTSQARLRSCYLDWQDVVFASPTMVSFTGGFFLCGARIRLLAPPTGIASLINIADNEFIADYCGFNGYDAVEVDGVFTSVSDVSISGTLAQPMIGTRSTTASMVVASSTPTTTFVANFSRALLFDPVAIPIRSVTYSLTLDAGVALVAHAARPAVAGVVTIDVAAPVTGSVTITVDQSERRSGA